MLVFFFFLTWFLSARFKGFSLRTQTLVISWFRLFSVFWRYIHLLKFSITCVFVFGFFVFFFFPRGQAWVFDFRNQALARLLSKKRPFMNLKNSAASAPEDMPGRGRRPRPHRSSAHPSVFSWTVVSQVPVLDPSSHQTSSYEKEKKRKKFL